MTNEQLLILLSGIMDEFSAALEEADISLASDRPKSVERQHRAPALCWNPGCEDPEHFQEIEVDAPTPELDALRLFGDRLAERIGMLRGERS